MRVAFKLAYIGWNYFGMQRQKGMRTIQEEVENALMKSGVIKSRTFEGIKYAGRTDRGVNAIGQVISFDIDCEKEYLCRPRVLNSCLPRDIQFLAYSRVNDSFDPRRDAVKRYYRQMVHKELNLDRTSEAIKRLIGSHDFTNFTNRGSRDESNIRNVEKICIRNFGSYAAIDFVADSFTWNMVRRLSSAILKISNGEKDLGWLDKMLSLEEKEGIQPLPPYGLILMDIKYDGIEFEVDRYSLNRFLDTLNRIYEDYLMRGSAINEMRSFVSRELNGSVETSDDANDIWNL
ncbi:MAG: tRNA pseudouridine(38-40) synthase TruA [Candidatus Methanolliviera hydrocarbonicum]|uniref:tRNA pseudouridine synthase A n=1 Tax=Candidatus Methanolliviera hydrocarbonicum TaxID=2491085 RepID=A0A520KX08_9EURY|nr:MAG: tRNA pseudouridine(38-40) synthase TruA [Candidatus Methanolliviera hydrocarbonicum]